MKNRSYNILFCISILLIVSATALALFLLRQAEQDRFWAEHRRQMETELNGILQNLFEMEASIRGFIISRDVRVMDNYKFAQDRLNKNFYVADSLVQDAPEQKAGLDSLKKLISQRTKSLVLIQEAAFAPEENEEERLPRLIVLSDDIMDDIREHIEMMSDTELRLLNIRTRNLGRYDDQSLISVSLTGFITLIVISFGFVKLKRETNEKELALLEKSEMLEVLKESELRYRNLNESANDAIIIADEFGKIISWNPAAVNMFGYGEIEVRGQPVSIIMPEIYKKPHEDGMKRLRQTGISKAIGKRLELVGRNKSSKEFPVEITLGHWKANNKQFFSAVIRDISEQKKIEKNMARLIENLKRSNQDLEQFAYVASHDLQEPLRKIQSFGDRFMIKYAQENNFPGQEYIMRMMEAANRMQVLIEDLLAFSRVSRNVERNEDVDLNEVLERVNDDLQIKISETNTIIKTDMLPVLKKASFMQLIQLFQNIINNAIKFRKPGIAPVINIGYKSVIGKDIKIKHVNAVSGKMYHEIKFSDNGIGFDTKYSEKIFTIFQRLHGRNEYAGTGIGLAVCRKICENYDGFIIADSVPGEGATFIIYLPK